MARRSKTWEWVESRRLAVDTVRSLNVTVKKLKIKKIAPCPGEESYTALTIDHNSFIFSEETVVQFKAEKTTQSTLKHNRPVAKRKKIQTGDGRAIAVSLSHTLYDVL
ncbi:hypothetical protein EVAR_74900_1 [Eumeta japonica]|uniref:Uncharacterized protein n=1 Tax=Eumeta variegata TaxID=151549 RepID=A0A4C1UI97_EUMVA|nr:hypothetical protein EVAR_74900_1 [Eumeta japonica]